MKKIILLVLVFAFLFGQAVADKASFSIDEEKPLVNITPNKPNPSVILQGGDTVDDATVVGSLPYSNSGTTIGYTDDYDEVCPYTGSTSPDVVYSYTPAADLTVDITLCVNPSDYDTKLYVYENVVTPTNPFACVDDACQSPGYPSPYQSMIEALELTGGNTYFIVVDGYGGDAGGYSIDIIGSEPPPPPPSCDGAVHTQITHMPTDSWSAGTSDAGSTEQYLIYDNYHIGVPVGGVKFWGLSLEFSGTWMECVEDPMAFEVKFYADESGLPGAELGTYQVSSPPTPTGLLYSGFELQEFEFDISPAISGADWISIQGNGDPAACWLLWMSGSGGDGESYQWDGSALVPTGFDRGFCLFEGTEPVDEIVYEENFDSGIGDWGGDWDITTEHFVSAPNSLTDSPGGDYLDSDTTYVELMTDIDLSAFPGASVEFMAKLEIETGFDYVYMYVSTDGGSNWNLFDIFNGEGIDWYQYSADLGGYAGQSVRFKFELETDVGYFADGMYIDDFVVWGLIEDLSAPLILHDGPDEYTSVPDDFTVMATITDFSGVNDAWVSYTVDDGVEQTIGIDSTSGDNYYFTIPMVGAGAHVNYSIGAEDNLENFGTAPEEHYVSGTVIHYEIPEPEFVYQYAAAVKIATRMTPSDYCQLVTGMYSLYTDTNRPLDTVDVMVWSDAGNLPDQELITTYGVWPWATLEFPHDVTYVDYRDEGLFFSDDFHVGLTYRSEYPFILGDSPEVALRSNTWVGGAWAPAGTDLYIKCVVDYGVSGIDDPLAGLPDDFEILKSYPNPFNASTVVEYAVTEASNVKVTIFNVLGQEVATLIDSEMQAGQYSVTWNAGNVPSGVYFARIDTDQYTHSLKMTLLK